ncbi:unnamed protein product, partial [Urochloa humidicola]
RTEVPDGGVDGVAAVEEEADEPRADEPAAARHADDAAAAAACVGRHRDRSRRDLRPRVVAWTLPLYALRYGGRNKRGSWRWCRGDGTQNRRGQGPSARLERVEIE